MISSIIRLIRGKDNLKSLSQRIGFYNMQRPSGSLIWIHAASLGESTAALSLVKAIEKLHPQYLFLITTTTISSSKLVQKFNHPKIIHQFFPIDNILVIRRFLNYWKPKLAIFVESELWPGIIDLTAKKMKVLLVNARLSNKSYTRWQKFPRFFQQIISKFSIVLAQSDIDARKISTLGKIKAINLTNLKFANDKLGFDDKNFQQLKSEIGKMPVMAFASTHPEDHEIIIPAISHLKKHHGLNFFPIIIPRHPHITDQIRGLCNKHNLTLSFRSKPGNHIANYDLYIADTLSEMGLFYNLAHICFVGGSFKRGGHNIIEPIHFNNIIMFGSDMSNFQIIADQMVSRQAAIQIHSKQDLIQQLEELFYIKGKKTFTHYSKNAIKYLEEQQNQAKLYLDYIGEFL